MGPTVLRYSLQPAGNNLYLLRISQQTDAPQARLITILGPLVLSSTYHDHLRRRLYLVLAATIHQPEPLSRTSHFERMHFAIFILSITMLVSVQQSEDKIKGSNNYNK